MCDRSLPWEAMLNVMDDLVVRAYNVLVQRMNEIGHNSPEYPEYWVCELLDKLRWPSEEDFIYRTRARKEYIQTCFSVSAFVYEYAGRVFDDADVTYEIRLCWERELNELFWMNAPEGEFTCRPEDWHTQCIRTSEPHVWNRAQGVLLHHSQSREGEGKAARIERPAHQGRKCALLEIISGVFRKLHAVRWRRNAN